LSSDTNNEISSMFYHQTGTPLPVVGGKSFMKRRKKIVEKDSALNKS